MPITAEVMDAFLDHFSIEPVTTAEQALDAGRLRHRVYCEELSYEPVKLSGIEADRHDAHSLHCIVRHIRSGSPAGCVRLICASGEHTLALEEHCLDSLYLEFMNTLGQGRESVCEVSRLAVAPVFRTRPHEGMPISELRLLRDCSDSERLCFPLITTATFLAASATADLFGRPEVFGMMEASLPRLLRRTGIDMQPAGNFTEYHGRRAAHFVTLEDAMSGMRSEVRKFYDSIHAELAANMHEVGRVAVA